MRSSGAPLHSKRLLFSRPSAAALAVAFCTAALGLAPLPAAAQPVAEAADDEQVRTYPREYFDPYNPQTARDIVDRVPGFTLDTGDSRRGFGGAAGNVLVDGARPTSKTGGVEEALSRIPANDVARVEVIRGAAGASEASGQTVVANIIRAGKTRSASWLAELERNSEGVTYPRFEGALTARLGQWSTSTKLNGFWEQFDLVGRRDRFDAAGDLELAQTEDRPSVLTEGFASTEAIRPLRGGTLTLNGRVGYSGLFPVTDRFQFDGREPDNAPDGRVYIDRDRTTWTGEASVDWTRTFQNNWTSKSILLASAEPRNQLTVVREERPVNIVSGGSRFENRRFPIETILRTTMARGGDSALKPEVGVEAAYNRLDTEFSLTTFDADGNPTAVELPSSDVLVEELRAETFANLIWTAAPQWTVETGIAVEASEISVSGDADNTQSFVFAKPFANFIYRPHSSLQLQLGARRDVGQLDFTDFAASADADVNRQFGGNPDLGPDQTWRASFAADWRREALGAINVEVFHEWRSDVLEQVALPSGAFGLANAGSGRVWGVESSASLQLRPVIPGGLLEVRATIQDSTFDDPLTQSARALDDIESPIIDVNFRQDLPRLGTSWGVNYSAPEKAEFFFGDEISQDRTGGEVEVFVETTRYLGVKSRFAVRGVGGRSFRLDRFFFTPDRSGAFAGSEIVDRERGLFLTLTVEGQS